jgi:hypothetical protein
MRAYSLKKAKEIVRAFNLLRGSERVAQELGLPVADVKNIVKWLDKHDPCNHARDERDDTSDVMAVPTSHIWLLWLYEHNASPRTAAACVNWPYKRVLTSCGGEEEWLKICGRESAIPPKKRTREPQGPHDGDPMPDEILQLAESLRLARG